MKRWSRVREPQFAMLGRTMTLMASGGALPLVLQRIVECIEAEHHGMLCSVFLLDEATGRMRVASAPSLPDFYNTALDGVAIGPNVGACGRAAYTNARVITVDIRTDPLWIDFRALAARAGLRSCWSEPIRGANGRVLGTFGMYHRRAKAPGRADIKSIAAAAHLAAIAIEHKRAQEALAASEARHRLFADNATDMIMTSDLEGRLTYISPAVARVTGFAPEQLVGRLSADLIHPEDAPGTPWVSGQGQARAGDEEGFRFEYRGRHKDGRWLWFESRSSLIHDPLTGAPTGRLDVAREITERKRDERVLMQAKDEAEAANRAKSTFLATMSHEIRTPLNGVLGMAQAMAMDDLAPAQRERLEVIRRSGQSLLAILNDVLDLSKIEAGKLELESAEFDVEDLARSVRDMFAPAAEAKACAFSLAIEPAAAGVYRGDPTRVRQILCNLVSNAVKFTSVGQVRLLIGGAEEGLELRVEDSGIGMSPREIASLFAKFQQADASTTRRFGGTGLGLAICRELASLMGGTIRAESQDGEGSTFTVVLPLPRVGDSAPAAEVIAAPAGPAAPGPVLRVLAAEDNAVNQLVLKALLKPLGIEPVIVATGMDAILAWEAEDWDVILMDVQMPEMDGPTATRLIREHEARSGRPRTPIIALTANAMSHQVEAYRADGMDDFVAKPIEVGRLFAAIEAVLTTPAAEEAGDLAAAG